MRTRAVFLAVGGALAGGALGLWLAQQRAAANRSRLFSPSPFRRLAALGYLARQDGAGTVALLRDYVRWEEEPLLRRRASVILRSMEARLG